MKGKTWLARADVASRWHDDAVPCQRPLMTRSNEALPQTVEHAKRRRLASAVPLRGTAAVLALPGSAGRTP
jgi:hypothetical protein